MAHESDGKGDPLGDRLKTEAGATLPQLRKLSERARWSGNSTGRHLERGVGPDHWGTLGSHSSTLTCFLISDVSVYPSLNKKLSL